MSEQSGPFSGGGSVRRALSLGICYVLGTFNDNFFKQGALLLALAAGNTSFPAWATVLFSLPFALFSVWAGWLADRFPKKNLVMGAKTLELAAMLAGAWGLLAMNWAGLAAMLFCMGLSSTLFSPALNGSIPELFPIRLVPRINALFKLATTASILLGISLAGIVLDMNVFLTEHVSSLPPGIPLLAFGVVGVALLGLCCSPFIPRRPAAAASRIPGSSASPWALRSTGRNFRRPPLCDNYRISYRLLYSFRFIRPRACPPGGVPPQLSIRT